MIYHFEDLSFRLLMIERFTHRPGFFEVSKRPYAALSFRKSGTGRFQIANKTFHSAPGSVLFIPADTAYTVEYSVSESIVVHFGECNYTVPELWHAENPYQATVVFQNLLDSWREQHSVNHAKSILFDFFDAMETSQISHSQHALFSDCVRYLDENFYDPELSIERLYTEKFISASTLHRLFIRHLGISPKQYLTKLRLNQALSLLAQNKSSVKEIAFLCGFSDEKYFSRMFKEKYGYPPSQMRNHIIV